MVPVRLPGQVPFVEDAHRQPPVQLFQQPPVPGVQGPGGIEHRQHQVAPVQQLQGAGHPQPLYPVVGLAQPRRVGEVQQHLPHPHRLPHHVPGGAGDVGDDALFLPGKEVHQGGLSNVGAAQDGGGDAPPHQPPGVIAGGQPPQFPLALPQGGAQAADQHLLHVLLRVVDPGGDVGGGIGQALRDRRHRPEQRPPPGLLGGPHGLGALGGDDIRHPFRLGEGHLAPQDRPLGELPRVGQPGPRRQAAGQQPLHPVAAAVAAEFRHLLPGVAFGGVVDEDHAVIQGNPGFIHELTVGAGVPRQPLRRAARVLGPEHPPGHRQALPAGEPYHPDAPALAGGDGGDGVSLPGQHTGHVSHPFSGSEPGTASDITARAHRRDGALGWARVLDLVLIVYHPRHGDAREVLFYKKVAEALGAWGHFVI